MSVKIVPSQAKMLSPTNFKHGRDILQLMEFAGRTCYKSEDKQADGTAEKFGKMLIRRGHESVLEHMNASFKVVCDRGISHEIVRHRVGFSYSQESTRYCKYSGNGKGLAIIDPSEAFIMNEEQYGVWLDAMNDASQHYDKMIAMGCPAELARSVLPNSLKTEIVITGNVRSWRNFITLRSSKAAHPQIRLIANDILRQLNEMWPELFEDVVEKCK